LLLPASAGASEISTEDVRLLATNWIHEQGLTGAIAFPEALQLTPRIVIPWAAGTRVRLQQTLLGIPVHGHEVILSYDLDGKLVKALASSPATRVEEKLTEARKDIRRLIRLLESLLDIAANKARKGEILGLTNTDLSVLTERICELYADSAEESGHAFSWDIAPGVELPVEEAQFARLVTNLLDNAFKYVPSGGEVRLSLEPGPRLVVEDNGPGIEPEERQRIFERFYRGKCGTDDAQGNGLGLALAQAIAIRHGLEIALEDTTSGACFVVARRDG
jgi:signal transduction histidine kinase